MVKDASAAGRVDAGLSNSSEEINCSDVCIGRKYRRGAAKCSRTLKRMPDNMFRIQMTNVEGFDRVSWSAILKIDMNPSAWCIAGGFERLTAIDNYTVAKLRVTSPFTCETSNTVHKQGEY